MMAAMRLSLARPCALAVIAALALLPACDKGGGKADDKSAKSEPKDDTKTNAKADAGADGDAAADGADAEHSDHGVMPEGDGAPGDAPAVLTGDGKVEIAVDAGGYHPARIEAPADAKVTLAFTRKEEAGCGQQLVIASMDVEKELPLNETVEIEVTVPADGEVGFACGMNMYKGQVVATKS